MLKRHMNFQVDPPISTAASKSTSILHGEATNEFPGFSPISRATSGSISILQGEATNENL